MFRFNLKEPYLDSTEIFESLMGKWIVSTSIISSSLSCKIAFEPSLKIPKHYFENIKISLNLKSNSGITFAYRATYFHENQIFLIKKMILTSQPVYINIDATSLPTNCEGEGDSFPKNSKVHMRKMFESRIQTDVTIKTNDKEIKCHKFVLLRSDVFGAMLNSGMMETQEGIIEITDIDHNVLEELIRYLYCDEIPEINEMALDLMMAGDKYQIKDLVDRCAKHLMTHLTLENFSDVLITADLLNMKELKDVTIKFINDNLMTIASKFSQLMHGNV